MKQRSQLVRTYVGKCLAEYYAQPANQVVGHSAGANSSNLSRLFGEWHWRRMFKKLYDEREGHWLTPVELFRPYYSYILANYCINSHLFLTQQQQQQQQPTNFRFDIVELGGGRGTNAELILSYIKTKNPDLYENLTYTIVDSSPSLHKLQKSLLENGEHSSRVQYVLKDLMHVAEEKVELFPKTDTPTVVIGCEILDNLPHDKARARSRKKIEQCEVQTSSGEGRNKEECFVPLSDPLLSKVIRRVPSYVTNYPTWIPTVACGLLQHMMKQRSNLSFVFADFDWLPAPEVDADAAERISEWAEGEPIVTDMKGIDHECYLMAPPNCDILFPTDFDKLSLFVKEIGDGSMSVQVHKQSEFLELYGKEHVNSTKSWLTGHTPLLHDFVNCSVITGRTNYIGSTSRNNAVVSAKQRRGPPKKFGTRDTDSCIMFYSTIAR